MKKINLSKPTLYLSGFLAVILLGSVLFFRLLLLPAQPQLEIQKTEVLGENTAALPSLSPSTEPSPSAKPSVKPVVKVSVKPSLSPSPSPSPVVQTANVDVQGSSFTVEVSGDLNVCQVMQRARDQGKISSLTLDDSYMSSMNSQYVREMNGMSNNWTFKVNGNSPLGCSLYQVKPDDQIVWKFG
jgi:hypothetical protein